MPPRRRGPVARRPRVAGRVPAATRSIDPADTAAAPQGAVAVDQADPAPSRRPGRSGELREASGAARDAGDGDTAALVTVGPETEALDTAAPAREAGGDEPGNGAASTAGTRNPRRPQPVVLLAAALVVLLGLGTFFGIENFQLRDTPAADNTALTDVAATSQAIDQLSDALKKVYSYDFTRLDENEKAARDVITGGFGPQFDQLFTQVRQLAPQQQAVVTATVTTAAARELQGDRAVLVVFMDQQATRAADNKQLAAAGRLTVTGQLVDGRWKIADVQSH